MSLIKGSRRSSTTLFSAKVDRVSEAIQKITPMLAGISNRDADVQTRYIVELKRQVAVSSRRLQGDSLIEFHKRLRNDMCKNLSSKVIAAIRTIVEVINVDDTVLTTDVNLTMFGRNLSNVLPPFGTDREVVAAACHAVGALASRFKSSVMAEQFVKRHAEHALEWLENSTSRNELKRFAAVLILEELVVMRPSEFVQRIPDTFETIFKAIHDNRLHMREAGVKVLKQCLMLWRGRAHYPKIYSNIEVGFRSSKEEMIHGSLLAASAFVTYTGDYINDTQYYQSVCDSTIKHFDTRKDLVQTALISLIPQLARVRRGVFLTYKLQNNSKVTPYFKVAINFIIRNLSKDRFRLSAINAVGDLATELKQHISPYLDKIVPELKHALDRKFQKGRFFSEQLVTAACNCISKLVGALGEDFSRQAVELLKPLFDAGLCTPQVATLQAIAHAIPSMDDRVQRKILDVISFILQGTVFEHPGLRKSRGLATAQAAENIAVSSNKSDRSYATGVNSNGAGAAVMRTEGPNTLILGNGHGGVVESGPSPSRADLVLPGTGEVAAQVLALSTLRTFDFRCHSLTQFAQDCVAPMMFHEDPDVREAACVTTAAILVRRGEQKGRYGGRADVARVSAIVLQLLTAGISDRKSRIRCAIINALGPDLEPYLAKVDALRMLFVCLYDEDLPTRLSAVRCAGRLCNRNPAYVIPALAKLLVQLLNDLTVCEGTRAEETAMKLLVALIQSAPRVAQPYIDAVVLALRSKLDEPQSNVFGMALSGMGELAAVDEATITAEVPKLMNVILDVLREQSLESQKEIAVTVLGQITRATGYVIQPYADFPILMPALFGVLAEAQTKSLRTACIRVFGILGALDPYQEKQNRLEIQRDVTEGTSPLPTTSVEAAAGPPGARVMAQQQLGGDATMLHPVGSEEHFMDLVVSELMAIAYDTSLIHIHVHVIRSCGILVVKAGVKVIPYLPQLVPAFIHMVRECDDTERHALINELAKIIKIFAMHLRPYVGDITDLVIKYWLPIRDGKYCASPPRMHTVIIGLLKALVNSLGVELQSHIPELLKHCMGIFQDGKANGTDPIFQALEAITVVVGLLDELMPSVAGVAVGLVTDFVEAPLALRTAAANTLEAIASEGQLGLQSTPILIALCGVVKHDTAMRNRAFEVLLIVIQGMGDDYIRFGHQRMVESMLEEVLSPDHLSNYSSIVKRTLSGRRIVVSRPRNKSTGLAAVREAVSAGESNRTTQEYMKLLAKEAIGVSSKFDLDAEDWMNRLIKMVYKESRSTAIAACQNLAEAHPPFARKMFKAAFSSCWVVLDDPARLELVEGLERVMDNNTYCTLLMLNVAEFMSHYESIPSLFSNEALGKMGLQCHTYAKALRYKEVECGDRFSVDQLLIGQHPKALPATADLLALVEDMIQINQALQEPEAARGVMEFVRTNMEEVSSAQHQPTDEIIPPSWYEKLDEWDKALEAYERRLTLDPQDFEMALGRMRCLDSLGKWQELHELVEGAWPLATDEQRQLAAHMACSAAAGLGVWDAIATYLEAIPSDDPDYSVYSSMLCIYNCDYEKATKFITLAREQLEPSLISLWQESYSRGHSNMAKVQILAELEEIMLYKQTDDINVQTAIRRTWSKRLSGCQYNLDVWLPIMKVRSLVLQPEDDPENWLEYCALCRKQSESSGTKALGLQRSHDNLIRLLGVDPFMQPNCDLPTSQPEVTYAYIKWMWVDGQADEAIQHICHLIEVLASDQSMAAENTGDDIHSNAPLLARCYHKLGQWRAHPALESAGQISMEVSDDTINSILDSYHAATHYDSTWYTAWHAWAFMSYEAVSIYESADQQDLALQHANSAIAGFFNSIGLSEGSSNLQDTLRLLTLWFKYGGHPAIADTIDRGVHTVSVDTWVQVIAQLIARIQVPDPKLRQSIHDILLQVGKTHPQALVFPLTVASHTKEDRRREAAEELMNKICDHSPELVNQALLVSQELIRVAVSVAETWFEGLDEAGRHYADRNIDAMFATLEPLHEKVAAIARSHNPTASDKEFLDSHGAELNEAWDKCLRYRNHGHRKDIEAAWDHYHQVYRMLSRSLPSLTSLELSHVSPRLADARDLQLAVPGTYLRSSTEPVYIQSFIPRLSVINSKQRPRKFALKGTDGKEYQYLLKAHEDIRQDERVMQLFGLVNTLLAHHPSTAKKLLEIKTYFVMPLSPTSGLIEWVATADTLHSLVRVHRERKGIPTNQEVRLMLQHTPDYDKLAVIQKIEVFRAALAQVDGDDIARVMWLQSENAESWLERRTTYIKTLAVMSMVGYILGLGDRHPSNLMLDRITGSIMHVDFGDCFEVAMQRQKFPEKVPFRLTRMLMKAMEVCGIEGAYRITCEKVMSVLRSNADSIVAVLEAFVHDPLIDWFVKLDNPSSAGNITPSINGMSDASEIGGPPPRSTSAYSESDGNKNGDKHSNPDSTCSDGEELGHPGGDLLNPRAIRVLDRVKDKLTGRDFQNGSADERLDVPSQVRRLIKDATMHENLCQHYTGWCSFW